MASVRMMTKSTLPASTSRKANSVVRLWTSNRRGGSPDISPARWGMTNQRRMASPAPKRTVSALAAAAFITSSSPPKKVCAANATRRPFAFGFRFLPILSNRVAPRASSNPFNWRLNWLCRFGFGPAAAAMVPASTTAHNVCKRSIEIPTKVALLKLIYELKDMIHAIT